ncbi:hypothetical protein [Pedobacter arcticus]|uniref:hypothetical protein n=1 Tax=Pedobacter arcticus TaxID=752140 RepID=UPI0012B676F7|nr:hypothetical protein [Pedobacter arcticus]
MLNKLSQLENYLSVSKEDKKKIDLWSLLYMLFIGLYLSIWVSYSDINQYVTYGVFVVLASFALFNNAFLLRIKLVSILILTNPLINSLFYSGSNRFIKLGILSLLVLTICLIRGKTVLKITKLILVMNIVFCLTLIPFYYSTRFQFNTSKTPPISKIISPSDSSKDVYIILLDAFPSNEVLEKYFGIQSRLHTVLLAEGFTEEKHITKYTATQQSIPNLFSGIIFKGNSDYFIKDIAAMKSLIPGDFIQQFSKKYKYEIEMNSLLLEEDNNLTKLYFGRGSDFSIYWYPIINRVLNYCPFLEDWNNREVNEQIDYRFNQLKSDLADGQKKISFFHFLTFHNSYYDINTETQTTLELAKADIVGIKAVKMILEAKPNAKIIVTSDHGIRYPGINIEDTYKGILYIKN